MFRAGDILMYDPQNQRFHADVGASVKNATLQYTDLPTPMEGSCMVLVLDGPAAGQTIRATTSLLKHKVDYSHLSKEEYELMTMGYRYG